MKRTIGFCGLLVLVAMTASCSFKIFEDIGSDPHPPTVEITELVIYVKPKSDSTTTSSESSPSARSSAESSPRARSSVWDSGGFTLTVGELFQIRRLYTDAGGDIMKFHVRDRDGDLRAELVPGDLTFYAGTSGTILGPADGLKLTGMYGAHRLELWAEDSHASISEKVEFVINLVP